MTEKKLLPSRIRAWFLPALAMTVLGTWALTIFVILIIIGWAEAKGTPVCWAEMAVGSIINAVTLGVGTITGFYWGGSRNTKTNDETEGE